MKDCSSFLSVLTTQTYPRVKQNNESNRTHSSLWHKSLFVLRDCPGESSLERLLLVTDVSTTWVVVIFRVKWRVIVRWWYLCLWSWSGLVIFTIILIIQHKFSTSLGSVQKVRGSMPLQTIHTCEASNIWFHTEILILWTRSVFLFYMHFRFLPL